jgi:hypothetical protein
MTAKPDISGMKDIIIRIIDELPPEQAVELLDFALFLKYRSKVGEFVLKAAPAADLERLVGRLGWGGDALADTERLNER